MPRHIYPCGEPDCDWCARVHEIPPEDHEADPYGWMADHEADRYERAMDERWSA